ncbi:hypothetical protein TNCV_2033771 [Trichonephila clavipes]|nr:hypothetical protein TNCV_2033771 [Trichonephila clavipes]
MRSLPIILLGLRTIWRADLEATPAELLLCKQKPFIFKGLKDCSHVFIYTDIVRRSLQPPYHGPYKIEAIFSDNSSENDIESSIGEDTSNKPAEMPVKKIREICSIAPSYFNQSDKRWTSSSFTSAISDSGELNGDLKIRRGSKEIKMWSKEFQVRSFMLLILKAKTFAKEM